MKSKKKGGPATKAVAPKVTPKAGLAPTGGSALRVVKKAAPAAAEPEPNAKSNARKNSSRLKRNIGRR